MHNPTFCGMFSRLFSRLHGWLLRPSASWLAAGRVAVPALLTLALLLLAGQGTAAASAPAPLRQAGDAASVTVADSSLGQILVGENGMTLYMFDKDTANTSNCYDQCAVRWPPLLIADGATPTAGEGVTANLGVTERTDGTYQVTANGMPLYYWYEDKAAGDVKGQAVGDVWWVLAPDGTVIRTAAAEATPETTAEATPEATAAATEEPTAMATEAATPAATEAATEEPTAMATEAATAEATTEATAATEEATPAATEVTSGSTAGASVTVADSSLGQILVGENGMTLYMFDKDTANTSNCYDQCAVRWPPLLIADGATPTAGEGVTANLGVTERTDGTYQVTANGMPLYYWYEDKAAGDVKGQAVGDVWWVLAPDGTVIRTAAAEATPEATAEATPEATAAATEEPTAMVTEAATEAATAEATAAPAATEATAPTQLPVTGGDGGLLGALLAGLGVLAGGGWVMLRNLRR